MAIKYLFGLVIALLFIRLVSLVFCLPSNFDFIWKAGEFDSFSPIIYWLLGLLSLTSLIYFIKKLGKTDNKIKNCFFAYFLFLYLSYLLFSRYINIETLDYLFVLNYSTVPFKIISPNLILDLFYEPPYLFFMLVFTGIIYFICRKKNHIEYSVLFLILSFFLYHYRFNDLNVTCLISYNIVSLLGMRYSKRKTALPILSVTFLIIVLAIACSYKFSKLDETFLKLAIETLIIFFIPAFFMCFICKKSNEENALSLTWIIPTLTLFFLYLPLYRLQTGDCLTSFISFTNTFLISSNLMIAVLFSFIITYPFEKLSRNFGKITFYMISVFLIIFYIFDAVLYYYSQFRINYHTIVWTQAMDDIVRTTFATCLNYLSPQSILVISTTFILAMFILLKGNLLFDKNSTIKINLLFIFLISQISIALLQLSNPIPEVFREPFTEFVKSIPLPDYSSKCLSFSEVEKEFKDCGIPLKEFEEKTRKYIGNTNVILITLESVHWRYVNMFGKEPKTWPMMSKLKDRMVIFPFIYSCYPESTCGDFAVMTGLNPYDYLYLSKRYNFNYKTICNELKKNDYNILFFSSTVSESGLNNLVKSLPLDYKFIFSSKDSNKDNSWEWGYKEEYTINKIIEYLKNRNTEKPYFLWYRTIYPHVPFPLFDLKNKLFQDYDKYGVLTLVSGYQNALTYLDQVLYDFITNIAELDKINNQKTLIVMVGDHGEKLGEKEYNGSISHGLNTTSELQNVVCIFIKPENNGLEINKNYGSQIDILPTILDYLKIEPSVERYEQGMSLYRNDLASRPIYLSSMKSYAIIEDGYFFEFRDKNSPNFIVTKLGFSDDELKPTYEKLQNWKDHKEIYDKHQRVKKFFELQKYFLNQLK